MPAGDHRLDRRLGRHQRAPDVELVDPVPRVAGVLLGIEQDLAGAAADRVDDDVEAPELGNDLGNHSLGVGLVRDVGRERDAFGAARADLLGRGFHPLSGLIDDGDARARTGKRPCKRRSDGPAAARHHGGPAIEPEDVELTHAWNLTLSYHRLSRIRVFASRVNRRNAA